MLQQKPAREPGQDIRTLPTYTVPEAAQFLAIEPWTLLSWYQGSDSVLKLFNPYRYGVGDRFILLSFFDLEEAYKYHLLRTKYEYTQQYLRDALLQAKELSKSEHPLIDREFSAFTHLAMHEPGRGRRKRRTLALGAPHASWYFSEVVDAWGVRIVKRTPRHTQLYPWRFAYKDHKRGMPTPVLIDPEVLSGRLVVAGTRIPVNVLWKRAETGESVASIASDYGLAKKRVEMAIKHLGDIPKKTG